MFHLLPTQRPPHRDTFTCQDVLAPWKDGTVKLGKFVNKSAVEAKVEVEVEVERPLRNRFRSETVKIYNGRM